MKRYTLGVLVRNKFGVLNRLTGMFRRRQFNISSITCSETESPDYARITFRFDGDEDGKKQLISQLYKLPDVSAVKELDGDASVKSELMLIKMRNDPETRDEIYSAAAAFKAETVDYTRSSVILRLVGSGEKLDNFISLMRDFEILEICRTGTVSLEKGEKTLLGDANN